MARRDADARKWTSKYYKVWTVRNWTLKSALTVFQGLGSSKDTDGEITSAKWKNTWFRSLPLKKVTENLLTRKGQMNERDG